MIAHDKVRYVGEPIARGGGRQRGAGRGRAGARSRSTSSRCRRWPTAPPPARDERLLFEETGSNRVITLTALRGDADAAFRDAPYVRRERFEVQRFTAVPMEPRGLLAEWDAAEGHLTVYGAAKVAFHNRRILAKQMGLPRTPSP